MHAEFNSIVLFTVLYSQFQHCAKDVSKVTVQCTILELVMKCPGQFLCALFGQLHSCLGCDQLSLCMYGETSEPAEVVW